MATLMNKRQSTSSGDYGMKRVLLASAGTWEADIDSN